MCVNDSSQYQCISSAIPNDKNDTMSTLTSRHDERRSDEKNIVNASTSLSDFSVSPTLPFHVHYITHKFHLIYKP